MSTADLMHWIIRQATESDDIGTLVDGIAVGLAAEGLPIVRLQIGMPSIDPKHRGIATTWTRGGAVVVTNAEHSEEGHANFRRSPIYHLRTKDLTAGRWNLQTDADVDEFPILQTLREDGASDYVLRLVAFPAESFILGVGFSLATDEPGGFSDAHIAAIDALLPAIGLAAYRIAVSRTANEALRVYVGPRTASRILAGEIHAGEGQAIYAAILYADMKNFTGLNERFPAERIVGWLNENFEALGAEIDRHGGEILKFMGDSLLAIFPVGTGIDAVAAACAEALAAAEAGLASTAALNHRRLDTDEPVIPVDVVLHLGEVFYGNVGAARRLDFTVIGPVVNEASRLEALCDRLGRNLVLSKVFADHCDVETERLGTFELKGVKAPHTVYGLAAAREHEE